MNFSFSLALIVDQVADNKTKRRILKRVFQENKARVRVRITG